MASKSGASITLVAKGDPIKQITADCPFCHRVLLTLAYKVGHMTRLISFPRSLLVCCLNVKHGL